MTENPTLFVCHGDERAWLACFDARSHSLC